jgi:N-methylhydantoinase B/oxoprolinase/acetone carboxylase alpha subunit
VAKRSNGLVDYSLAFTLCREGGHWWEYGTWNPETKTVSRYCVHGCKTVRNDLYDPATMRKLRSRYRYPSGYLTKDITKVDAAIHCRKLVERLIGSRGISFVRRAGATKWEKTALPEPTRR